jgi:HSP20 family molecular chaperone IbpA
MNMSASMTASITRPEVSIQELDTVIIVKIALPNVTAENLEFQITPEALLVWAEQRERVKIDGYCDFSYPIVQFHKRITFPHLVQPDTAAAELQANALIVTVLKDGDDF